MLNDEIEKKNQLKKTKKLKSIWLTHKIRNPCHETMINSW